MNILKFYRPNISEFFIGNLVDNDVALDLITNKEVNVSNCTKLDVDLYSNQHLIKRIEPFFKIKNKFIHKFYIPYVADFNNKWYEYFGFKIYDFNDPTASFDNITLEKLINSKPDLGKDPGEYAFFKSEINLEYSTFYTLNSLINNCIAYDVMSEKEINEFLVSNLKEMK